MPARLRLILLAALTLAGCHVEAAPELPIDDHVALCCKAAGDEPLSFTGCRPTNHCRAIETLWLRGPVHCGPIEASRCAGGRCCSLTITPDAADRSIAGRSIADQSTETETETETDARAPSNTTAPAPAPIVPMAFESPP